MIKFSLKEKQYLIKQIKYRINLIDTYIDFETDIDTINDLNDEQMILKNILHKLQLEDVMID